MSQNDGPPRILTFRDPLSEKAVRTKDLRVYQFEEGKPIVLLDMAAPEGYEMVGAMSRDVLGWLREALEKQKRERMADEEAGGEKDEEGQDVQDG